MKPEEATVDWLLTWVEFIPLSLCAALSRVQLCDTVD